MMLTVILNQYLKRYYSDSKGSHLRFYIPRGTARPNSVLTHGISFVCHMTMQQHLIDISVHITNVTESTVRKNMATGTFTHNALHTKTLKEHIKTQRKIVSRSNLKRAMLLVQARLPLNHIFLYAQWALFGSQGIVAKCTATIFLLTVDWSWTQKKTTQTLTHFYKL